jgi:GTPase SAR1 family protein
MPQYQFAEKAKYKEWFEEYNRDNCKLNRQEYGEFLANYITGEHDGFVLNLNGSWGTGKTHFLKRLYTHLLTKMGHPTIYIDAWESDFTGNPLAVVSSELISQLSSLNSNIGGASRPVKKLFGSVLKAAIVGTAAYIGDKIDQKDTAVEGVKTLFEIPPEDFVDQLNNNYQEQVSAIKSIRSELSSLAEILSQNNNANLPIIVCIDELDRCRPDYAIEMLEVIKHFFDTKNFVFVVASDTEQLCHSIKAIYGDDFKSDVYLRRFFNRTVKLDKPDIESYIRSVVSIEEITPEQYNHRMSILADDLQGENFTVMDQLTSSLGCSGLALRDIDQIISKYQACLRHISHLDSSYICTFNLITELIGNHLNYPDNGNWEKAQNSLIGYSNNSWEKGKLKKLLSYCQSATGSGLQARNIRKNPIVATSNPTYIEKRLVDQLNRFIESSGNGKTIWQRDDYRKLVELAGAITD